ncbi:MAG: hypothetical protein HGA63_10300, partial [Syntrophobacteraceae bacterium]|nr:hypothetical protein [Syntrophobacteraceae bacterium]
MGVHSELAARCGEKHDLQRKKSFGGILLGVVLGVMLIPNSGSAVQRHDLMPAEAGQASAVPDRQAGAGIQAQHAEPAPQSSMSMGSTSHGAAPSPSTGAHGPAAGQGTAPVADAHKAGAAAPSHGPATATEPAKAAHAPAGEHAAPAEGHAVHGPALPEISPIPGVSFVEAMINVMEHELKGRFF